MKRKKFNLGIGLRLLFAGLAIALGNFFAAALCLVFPVIALGSKRLAVGASGDDDEDETEELLKTIKKQTSKLLKDSGFISKEQLDEHVENVMKAYKELDVDALKSLLGDSEKGFKAIVKAQGIAIAELQEAVKGKGPGMMDSLKSMLNKEMDKIKAVSKSRTQSMTISLKAAADMTLDNTITGDDTLPEDLIESFSIGAFVPKRFPREYVFDMANRRTVAEITQFKTWLEEGDTQGAFAIVAEGAVKPLISASLVRNSSEYAKVAGKYVVTEEFAKFRKNAYAIIQRIINQKILRDYASILTTRLLADAAPYVASALDGQYDNPTDYHAIAAVAAQIEGLEFVPDLLIINSGDKWRIGMTQDTVGQFYLTIPVTDPSGTTRIMGFVVRTSNKIPVGNFLLGEAGLWEIEDEAITIRLGYGIDVTGGTGNGGGNVTAVSGDLDNNRFRVIVETFFHSYIATNNKGSFVYGNFAAIKALVTA